MALVRTRAADLARIRYVFAPTLPAIAVGLVVLGALFHAEIGTAVDVWSSSTAYSHCYFVLPIVAWLAWDRRDRIFGLRAQPVPAAAVLALVPGAAWLLAERLGIMEGRQLALIGFIWVLFLATLGPALFRALMGPLLYLVFLVPFGGFVTGPLQTFTTRFTGISLDILGIPNDIDSFLIRIPEGAFYVAQACAGLRFLIASIAFGALYGLLMYRSNLKRAAFLLMSVVVPVVANGFRALGIVALGHYIGSAQAAATDHVLYGWIFFSIVILIQILIGLPFRDDLAPRPRTMPPAAQGNASPRLGLMACGTALAAIVVAPLAAHLLNGRGDGDAAPRRVAPAPAAGLFSRRRGYNGTRPRRAEPRLRWSGRARDRAGDSRGRTARRCHPQLRLAHRHRYRRWRSPRHSAPLEGHPATAMDG